MRTLKVTPHVLPVVLERNLKNYMQDTSYKDAEMLFFSTKEECSPNAMCAMCVSMEHYLNT